MASHNQPGADILRFGGRATYFDGYQLRDSKTKLPVSVRPIPAEQIARIMGESVDLYKSLEQPRRGLLDRIADWFSSERGFGFALGFYSGCMFTVAVALLIASTPMTFR